MLYMIVEHFRNGDPIPVYQRFRDRGRLAPNGLDYISSWVDEKFERCFQIMETADRGLLDQWIANWHDIVDFDIPQTPPRAEGVFRGKVFALVDRQTYSNAVAVAATIQDYKFGVILGEETSDLATTYGAMEQFKLKNTGISVGYPKARIVRPNGSMRARGVVPEVRIQIPIVQGPSDEVLRQAVEIAKGR